MTALSRRQAWSTHLASANERTFARAGYLVTILRVDEVQIGGKDALRVEFRIRNNGNVIEDNWVIFGGPPTMVDDGPNPAYDPENPASPARLYREDVREAFRVHLLQVMESVVARRAAQ